jgi:hypothetical protein
VEQRHLAFERLRNFRDPGGYPAEGGRTVRWNHLYRSDSAGTPAGADLSRLRRLGVRAVIGLPVMRPSLADRAADYGSAPLSGVRPDRV